MSLAFFYPYQKTVNITFAYNKRNSFGKKERKKKINYWIQQYERKKNVNFG